MNKFKKLLSQMNYTKVKKILGSEADKMLAAAFEFLGAAIKPDDKHPADEQVTQNIFSQFTAGTDKDENGKFNLNISLDEDSLRKLSATLASIMTQN